MSGTWENADWSTAETGQATPVNWVEGSAALFAVHSGASTPAFTVTMNSNHTVAGIFNGSQTPGPCAVIITGNGIISSNNGVVLYTTSSGTTTISNVIAGPGAVAVEGSGNLYLTGLNTYTGGTTINGGTLVISSDVNLGGITGGLTFANGGTLQLQASTSMADSRAITLGSGGGVISSRVVIGGLYLTGQITGGGGLIIASGDIILQQSVNNSLGTVEVLNGRLFIFNAASIFSASFIIENGATLDFGGGGSYAPINIMNFNSGSCLAARTGNPVTVSTANATFPSKGTMIFNNDDVATTGIALNGNYPALTGELIIQVGGGRSGITSVSNPIGTVTLTGVINGGNGDGLTLVSPTTTTTKGTLVLNGANTYSGSTIINSGTLALGSGGSINNSADISIAAGGTFDVSAYPTYNWSGSTTLSASGTGATVGSTAAAINGASGGTISLGSQPISLTFTPTTFNGDTTHPSIYIPQGILSLNGNVFTVSNTSGTALGTGTYLLIQQASGNITGSGSYPVRFTGSGLVSGDAASIQVSGGNVNLVVTAVSSAITWNNPAPVGYGTALSSNQLDATANVSGNFVYNPPSGTVLNVGTHTLSVIFTPTDILDYTSVTDTVSLVVFTSAPSNSVLPMYEPFTEYAANIATNTGGGQTNSIDLCTAGLIAPNGEPWLNQSFSQTAGVPAFAGLDIQVTNYAASIFTSNNLATILPSNFPGYPGFEGAITTIVINPAQPLAPGNTSYSTNANIVGNSAVLKFTQDFTRPASGTKTLFVSYLFDDAQQGQTANANNGRYLCFVASSNVVEGLGSGGFYTNWQAMYNTFLTNVGPRYYSHAIRYPNPLDVGPTDSANGALPSPLSSLSTSFNTASFVVGEFVFVSTNASLGGTQDTNILWLNPPLTNFGGPTPATTRFSAYPMLITMNDVGGLVLLDRPGSGQLGGVGTNYMANLILGNTWSYATGGPEFVNQPTNAIGSTVSLSAAATAAGQTVTYQWQHVNGSTTNNVTNGLINPGGAATVTVITNGNITTLTLSGISSSDAVGFYQVVATASNTKFTLTSSSATVANDPIIIVEPQSASAYFGGSATFSITATTVYSPLSFQWKLNGTNIYNGSLPDTSTVAIVTTSSNSVLTIGNCEIDESGAVFSCGVTNGTGSGEISSTALLTVTQATPITSWTNPVPITYGTPLSANQLDATANVPGNFYYTPLNGTVLNVGTNTLNVIFTPSNTVGYTSATNTVSLIVTPAPLTITANAQSKTYGQALIFGSGSTNFTSGGLQNGDTIGTVTLACSGNGGAATATVGAYTITPSAATGGTFNASNYNITYNAGTLIVTQAIPILTWVNPAPITYGTALNSNQLNATASVTGNFTYTPTTNSVPNAGTNTISLIFTPTDTNDYATVTDAVNLVVSPAQLTVTASNASRPYSQTNPVFTGTITGVTNGDNITATYSCSATTSSPGGSYAIVPSLVDPNNRLTNYTVSLVDGTLMVTSSVVIQSVYPPVINELAGDHVAYQVSATGIGPLFYQWYQANSLLQGQTSSKLVLTNIQASSSGQYEVTVVDNSGAYVTNSVTLNVSTTNLPLYPTNLVVLRVGDGAQTLSGATGNTIYLDQYTTTGVYVSSLMVPDENVGSPYGTGSSASVYGSPALLLPGAGNDYTNAGMLTLSSNGQFLTFAGYCVNYPFNGPDVTVEYINPGYCWRGLATLNASGQYNLAYTNLGLYNVGNHSIRGATTLDGTNFWTTGQAGSIIGGVKYVNSQNTIYNDGDGIPGISNSSLTGTRVVQVFGTNLIYSDALGPNGPGLYICNGTPEPAANGTATATLLLNEGGQPNDFAISPDGLTIYIADGRTFTNSTGRGGGIERWDTTIAGNFYGFSYTLPVYQSSGAQGLTVSFPTNITHWGSNVLGATLFATSPSNVLTAIIDNGPSSLATVLVNTGPFNEQIHGVRSGPPGVPSSGPSLLPPFEIKIVKQSGNSFTFAWSANLTNYYQIQSTTNLANANWTNLGLSIPATNTTMTVSEPIGTNKQVFYRIQQLQIPH